MNCTSKRRYQPPKRNLPLSPALASEMAPVLVPSNRKTVNDIESDANALEDFKLLLRTNVEEFKSYRDGSYDGVYYPDIPWSDVQAKTNWPAGARWPGLRPDPAPEPSKPTGRIYEPPLPNPDKKNRLCHEKVKDVAFEMIHQNSGLNFVKLLHWGAGGSRITSLFDARLRNFVDQHTRTFVVKSITQPDPGNNADARLERRRRTFKRERGFLKVSLVKDIPVRAFRHSVNTQQEYYVRSAHIAQLVQHNKGREVLRRGLRRRPRRAQPAQPAAAADAMADTIILEYLPRGDLHKFLCHLGSDPADRPPDPILWNMFGCCDYSPLRSLESSNHGS